MDCLKLTTYFGERDRVGSRLLADELFDLYGRHRLGVSALMRGAAGFGRHHRMRTDQLLTLSEDLPLVSVAVDTRAHIEQLLSDVMKIKFRGLVTLERATLLDRDRRGDSDAGDGGVQELRTGCGEEAKLTVYVGRRDRVLRVPAFVAVCELLRRRGLAGATVLLGVDGTHHGSRARARFFARNADVPIMIISVGERDRIESVLPELRALLIHPLITLERVRVCKRDGELLATAHELAAKDASGLEVWQKLTVHASESARHEGRPLHRSLIRRLRAADLAGATALRGIWGFSGEHAPHGDRLLQLRRHVPMMTVVIDRPQRITEAFRIIDELTSAGGLVTSELVPAATASESWITQDPGKFLADFGVLTLNPG